MFRENDSGHKVGSELGLTCDRLCRPEEGATAFISTGLGGCPLRAGAVLGTGDRNTNRAISSHVELTVQWWRQTFACGGTYKTRVEDRVVDPLLAWGDLPGRGKFLAL